MRYPRALRNMMKLPFGESTTGTDVGWAHSDAHGFVLGDRDACRPDGFLARSGRQPSCKGGSCRSQELPQAHAHPCFGDEKSQGASAHSAGVFTWLIRNRHHLAFDLLIEGRTDRFIEFSFVGVNRAISALLNTNEIAVLAELKGECWDLLMDWDSSPACGPTGYFCRSCLDHFRDTNPGEEFTKFFPSREAVWADDIFEPFLRWVNDDLAKAKWLGILRRMGACNLGQIDGCRARRQSRRELGGAAAVPGGIEFGQLIECRGIR